MDPQKTEEVEKELLELIIQHLEENKMDLEKAQALAKDFMAALPISSQQDLLDKLKKLGENYEEAKELYVLELAETSKATDEQKLNAMRNAIAKGDIESAISVAKTTGLGQAQQGGAI